MKHTLRHLWRNKIATAINVSGLAVALSAAFLMLQYLDFELSYDTYLPEHTEIYRIATEQRESGVVNRNTAEAYYALAVWITDNFDEVEAATRVNRWPANTGFDFEVDGKLFQEKASFMSLITGVRKSKFMESPWLRSKVLNQLRVIKKCPLSTSINHSTNGHFWKTFK